MDKWGRRGTGIQHEGTPPEKEPNTKLRELAGLLKSLPYRDMDAFAKAISAEMDSAPTVVDAILTAADKLETA